MKSTLNDLEDRLGANWSQLKEAKKRAEKKHRELKSAFKNIGWKDKNVVVFGSLGRDEFTDASDIDWTLLIDRPAYSNHFDLTQTIKNKISSCVKKQPGKEKLFGNMTFSHDLVHQIGGEDDTNKNISKRILLLLESKPIGPLVSYNRVINQILQRYVSEDDG